jgi:multicomponent Na+:H+ antiporter subunit D
MLAAVFLVAAFSLAGIPPTSGFYGKFGFALEGIREGHGWVVAASIVTGLFTLASMVKIWRYGFWGEPQTEPRRGPVAKTNGLLFATGLLTASAIFLAAHSAHFLQVVTHAGEQLMDRGEYIQAVLGQQGLDTHLVLTASQEVAQLP